MANILATAFQRGSVNALKKPIELLQSRGHEVRIYATGSKLEATGFGDLDYKIITPKDISDYQNLLNGDSLLLTGLLELKHPISILSRQPIKWEFLVLLLMIKI